MSKRKLEETIDNNTTSDNKKHTLDSDEEDSDDYEKADLNDSDIEGEEDGVAALQDDIKITPFNMREELQEGHFDKDGHYHWSKESEIRDNWLDNVDWVKVKTDTETSTSKANDDLKSLKTFNEAEMYAEMLKFMQVGETVQKTIQRLGSKTKKLSSIERIRQKKLGIVDNSSEQITRFTEITNEMLTQTGNMDIYQETYQNIAAKAKPAQAPVNDMYADDFVESEKKHLQNKDGSASTSEGLTKTLKWEFKWQQTDDNIEGPYSTEQMIKWAAEKYFKDGVYVRKVGDSTNFYNSNRMDFELYL